MILRKPKANPKIIGELEKLKTLKLPTRSYFKAIFRPRNSLNGFAEEILVIKIFLSIFLSIFFTASFSLTSLVENSFSSRLKAVKRVARFASLFEQDAVN